MIAIKKQLKEQRRRAREKMINTENYEDVKCLIWKTVSQFNRRHGGDQDAQMAIAHEAFMVALEKHDPKRGEFSTILVLYIHWTLWRWVTRHKKRTHVTDNVKQKWQRKRGVFEQPPVDVENGMLDMRLVPDRIRQMPFEPEQFDGTEDAQRVLKMALACGEDLQRSTRGKPWSAGDMLQDILDKLGWSAKRVTESFAEIREALG